MPLQDLRELWPDSFAWGHRTDGPRVEVFPGGPRLDRIRHFEVRILWNGIWSLEIDDDKRRSSASVSWRAAAGSTATVPPLPGRRARTPRGTRCWWSPPPRRTLAALLLGL